MPELVRSQQPAMASQVCVGQMPGVQPVHGGSAAALALAARDELPQPMQLEQPPLASQVPLVELLRL